MAERMEKVMCSKKKWIFITTVMITMILGITGCGKSTEDADQAGNSAVTAEDLPAPEEADHGEEPKAEDADAQNQPSEESADAQDSSEKDTPHYIEEGRDLYGDIWEVGESQFTVVEIYTGETEDGGDIMVAPADGTDEQKITVTYDESTKFVKKKIWDGGANHEEREGTAADLKKGLTAEMKGSYEGDVFHATEILIVEVILD